jgi:hypothetical protein
MSAHRKDYDLAVDLYKSGLTLAEVAEKFSVSYQAIQKVLIRRGVEIRKSSPHPEPVMREIERLLSTGTDDCQLWPFSTGGGGYGKVKYKGRTQSAHRLVFYLANGYKPIVVRHTCDTPLCCNPRHLIGGTHADNTNDMISRNRQHRGPYAKAVRPSADQVKEIRREFDQCKGQFPTAKTAMKYGLSVRCVQDIIYRRTWLGIH